MPFSTELYVKASNPEGNDQFGHSLALSGDGETFVVGDIYESFGYGAAYVYSHTNGVWSQQAHIASPLQDAIYFGSTVAAAGDGNTIAIAASHDASCASGIDGNPTDVNCAQAGGVWSRQAYLKPSNPVFTVQNKWFGTSLAFSADGNTLAVGGPGDNGCASGVNGDQTDQNCYRAGAVYVFTRSGLTWSQEAYVKASNPDPDDGFGDGVGLSDDGTIMAVGACCERSAATGVDGNQADNSLNPGAGAVYVFRKAGSWSQEAYLKASNTGSNHSFGVALALSGDGDTVVVGDPFEPSAAGGINGDQTDTSAFMSGALYVFRRINAAWSQEVYLKAAYPHANDSLGSTVAVNDDGTLVAAGAYADNAAGTSVTMPSASTGALKSGAVSTYLLRGSTWIQRDYVKASNAESGDVFGYSVSLSSSGARLLAGAPGEDSAASGIGGDQSDNSSKDCGAAYLIE